MLQILHILKVVSFRKMQCSYLRTSTDSRHCLIVNNRTENGHGRPFSFVTRFGQHKVSGWTEFIYSLIRTE